MLGGSTRSLLQRQQVTLNSSGSSGLSKISTCSWVNCSEYFPIFISLLWVAGIFFHQGVAAACGMLYLYTRFRYFQGYALAAQGRLGPLYASAWLLWLLVGLAVAGLLAHFLLLPSSPWALAWPLRLLNAW
ncbi:leukotriene C4 synthase isoform X2 [Anser cygnoides]|uniref:leukotriene C4 synthase isoform X2 n=1 Tax=Anser cygnoides TaxID=8845 RepID=UPI0034D18AE1